MTVHFIGIKGTGMAALAQIVKDMGYEVQGSDIEKELFTEEGLRARNIPILRFNEAEFKAGDTVVVGLSFDRIFPETARALATDDVEVLWYNEYLGKLIKDYTSICVAGCHGKSTTTGMLASILEDDFNTGYLIGDGQGHIEAESKTFVLESCEFQRHFLAYNPDYALITNIELDHVDYYKDLDDYISAFQSFIMQVKKGCVIFGDDPYLPGLKYEIPVTTYGCNEGNDYQAVNIIQNETGTSYDVLHQGKVETRIHLEQTGMPIVWDSLGAYTMAAVLGMSPEDITHGLESYQGIARRFVTEEVGNSIMVDDYAHHPTAIRNMIEAMREKYPDLPVVALYKPDRYSRLQYFLDDFAAALNLADYQMVLDFDTNAKREGPEITVTIEDLRSRLENGDLLAVDESSASKLARLAPAVYLFMSSKNIYELRDLLEKVL